MGITPIQSTTDIVVQTASMLHLQLVAEIAMYLPCGTRVGAMKVSGIAGIAGWPPRTVANVEWSQSLTNRQLYMWLMLELKK